MEKNTYIELAECLLPEEMVDYFEVVKVEKTKEMGALKSNSHTNLKA